MQQVPSFVMHSHIWFWWPAEVPSEPAGPQSEAAANKITLLDRYSTQPSRQYKQYHNHDLLFRPIIMKNTEKERKFMLFCHWHKIIIDFGQIVHPKSIAWKKKRVSFTKKTMKKL